MGGHIFCKTFKLRYFLMVRSFSRLFITEPHAPPSEQDALGVDVPEEQRVVTDDLAASMKQIINIATSGYSDEFLDPLFIQEPVDDELDVLRLLQGGL